MSEQWSKPDDVDYVDVDTFRASMRNYLNRAAIGRRRVVVCESGTGAAICMITPVTKDAVRPQEGES